MRRSILNIASVVRALRRRFSPHQVELRLEYMEVGGGRRGGGAGLGRRLHTLSAHGTCLLTGRPAARRRWLHQAAERCSCSGCPEGDVQWDCCGPAQDSPGRPDGPCPALASWHLLVCHAAGADHPAAGGDLCLGQRGGAHARCRCGGQHSCCCASFQGGQSWQQAVGARCLRQRAC